MKKQYPQDKTKKNASIGDILSLDLRGPVRGVRFDSIISFLIDNYNDTIVVNAASNTFDRAAHDAAWDHNFAKRQASMTITEQCLLATAMVGHSHAPDFGLDEWLVWDDAQRTGAMTKLLEKVTRAHILCHLLATHGQRIVAHRQVVINMIQMTRFCAQG